MKKNKPPRKVHLHHNGGAACGAVALTSWPHTVGRVVWPSVVQEYKCRACERAYQRCKLGISRPDNTPKPKPERVCANHRESTV
jgi:hypothetical protein